MIIYTKREENDVDKEEFVSRIGEHLCKDKCMKSAIIGDFMEKDSSENIALGYYSTVRNDLISMIDKLDNEIFNVLEIGCGTGATLQRIVELYPNAMVQGVEINERVVNLANPSLNVVCGNIEKQELTYVEHSFDYIILGDVIEHLVNPEAALKYLKKFLKQNGTLLISVPNAQHFSLVIPLLIGEFNYADAGILDRTHLRFFTWSSFKKLLESVGYNVVGMQKTYNIEMNEDWVEPILDKICEIGSAIEKDGFMVWQYQFKASPIFE